jgi:citrate synthase
MSEAVNPAVSTQGNSSAAAPAAKPSAAGLQGVVAAPSGICFIDGNAGRLVYRGYEITDLVGQVTFEETAFLLWDEKLPNAKELSSLRSQLGESANLPAHVNAVLQALPAKTQPMDALRTACSALSSIDPDLENNDHDANRRKAVRLTAQLPTIVAVFHRLRNGQQPVAPDTSLSVAGNFLWMMTGKKPHETVTRVLDAALVLHAEHGFNASTFAARVTAATLADMHAAITAAIAALKGPLHGGANQEVMELLLKCGDANAAEQKIRSMLANKEKVPGFGHRVYRTFDPRAHFLRKMSRELGEAAGNTKWYEMSERLIPILKDEKSLNPNVDFFSASAYYTMGIPIDLYTPIFAIARVAGWTAHVMEQHSNNRIIRPQDDYTGPFGLKVVPVGERK